jgi:hypothetical protein
VGIQSVVSVPRRLRVVGLRGKADAILIQRDCSRLMCRASVAAFGEVLLLAEDESDVVATRVSKPDDVKGRSDVDTLLFSREKCARGAVGKVDLHVPISQRSGENDDALSSLAASLCSRKWCQKWIIVCVVERRRRSGRR